MESFVARQPIFDRRREVYGYELLFRSSGSQTTYDGVDAASSTRQVISNTIFAIGVDRVLCGKRAFINFDESLLAEEIPSAFGPEDLVIEVLETVKVDDAVVEACAKLHKRGFALALDDFVSCPATDRLLPFAKFIKIDIRSTPRETAEKLLRTSPDTISFIAEKVETYEEFEWTRDAGYEFFQGHFFEKPEVFSGRDIPSVKLLCLQLLREVAVTEIDCKRTTAVIERDVGLTYKLLRYVNSALFGLRQKVDSVHHAVALLGAAGLRPWAAVAAIPLLASDKPAELAVKALVRAQFCDLLTEMAGIPALGTAFLIGLFSHLDGMLDLPLKQALTHVGLSDALTAILLKQENGSPLNTVYELIRNYEAGAWEEVAAGAAKLDLKPDQVSRAYTESTFWTSQALRFTSRKSDMRAKPRRAFGGALRIQWIDGEGQERTVNATLQNISETGIQLRVAERIPARSTVICSDVKLKIAGRGIVRYCNFSQGKYVIGVHFSGGTGWRDPIEMNKRLAHI